MGFEIAALRSDPENPWTLQQVVDNFETCNRNDDGTVIPDNRFPFCHLIDPNWIVRSPVVRCESKVYGQELLSKDTPQRREECVDVSTCIIEDENGNCTNDNYYGFCTQQESIWHLPGDSCQAEYATCRTFTNQETNAVVSYLTRTLDYGTCGPDAVGCRAYVTERVFGVDDWVGSIDTVVAEKIEGRAQVLHFNERIAAAGTTCPAGADGCSQFIGASRNRTTGAYIEDLSGNYIQDENRTRFIKQAPAYLGCYDTNLNTTQIEYPTTLQQIENDLVNDARCDAYAEVCIEEEVGCEMYAPVNAGQDVPGVVGDNFCPASCVGYNTFKQEATSFEPSEYPLYFIPDNGVSCNAQHVGCDEFTNISSLETGGEGLEYYTYIKQCERPEGDNSNVYYSWEGSDTQGFVLKVHTLAKVGDTDYYTSLENAGAISSDVAAQFVPNAPVYADDIPSELEEMYTLCNEELYTNTINNTPNVPEAAPDCRALYDSDGVVYYRMLADTVTVAESCQPLRKTESRLVVDEALTNLPDRIAYTICEQKQGYWDTSGSDPVCQRCAGGGSWIPEDPNIPEKGSCIYQAIDAPGESVSCIAEAVGCRAYTGNTGNNIKPVFEDTFEPSGTDAEALVTEKENWSPDTAVNIAAESVQVNLRSLGISGNNDGTIVRLSLIHI